MLFALRTAPRRLLALLLLVSLLVSLSLPALASTTSPLRFKHLGSLGTDELSILALMQDRQGFVWVGTRSGGLYRYNGYSTVSFTNKPGDLRSVPHDRVSTLFEDKQGRIWAGTQNGLVRYNPATNDFTRYAPPPGPSDQNIIKLIISDGKDGLWLATWGGLLHFQPATGKFAVYVHDKARADSLASNDINALALDHRGGLWAATWPGGIDYLAPGAASFQHFRLDSASAPDPRLNIVRALHIGEDRSVWMGTENGIVRWNDGSDWSTRRRIDSPATRIHHLYEDRDGTVWAATLAAGLARYDKGGDKPFYYVHRANDSNSLPSDHIRAVMHDRSGMLWVGSYTDGISVVNLNSAGFQRHIPFDASADNLRPDNSLRTITGAPDGRLWLSNNAGLSLFDPASGDVLTTFRSDRIRPGAQSNEIVYSVYQQDKGPLWVGTSAGLNRLDAPDQPFKVTSFGSIGANFINFIAPGSGNTLWLATGAQVIHYDIAKGTWKDYHADPADPGKRSVSSTSVIVEDRQGRVWMGSEWSGGGLDMLDVKTGTFRRARHDPGNAASLADDNVSAVYEDPQGRLWAGTAKGLNQVIVAADGAISFRAFTGSGQVGALKILSILSDQAGALWLSTAGGLLRVDPASGKADRYTTADGLSEGFIVNAAHRSQDGTLYFGGVRGMTGVTPKLVRSVSVKPQLAFTDVAVFNQSLNTGKPAPGIKLEGGVTAPRALTLSVEESVFTIEFAALHFTDPARNTYAYRLAGFDRTWVNTDAARRSATYTNLDPGTYVFAVKAANHHGVWNEEETRLTINILPPWYKSAWFLLTITLLGAGLLGAAYRARVNQLKWRQVQLEDTVAERTRELEDSNARLAELSTTDALTGISNRRGFDVALESEWHRAARNGYPLALAMLDVDHFKSYNDHYGHPAGDRCLREVAELIASHARRTSDLVARYGGEEFALLAPATDAEVAMAIARGICDDLARLALPHAKSPHGIITISIGVATAMPDEADSWETLIARSDRALYQAKQSGRNRAQMAAD